MGNAPLGGLRLGRGLEREQPIKSSAGQPTQAEAANPTQRPCLIQQQQVGQHKGRLLAGAQLHLTLQPIGKRPLAELEGVEAHG